jgi:DNA transformation protein
MSSPDFLAHVAEMLAPLGTVRSTRMFGGIGIYVDGLFCALVMDDSLYFKGDEENIAAFTAAGCEPFTYEKKGEVQVIKYYRVPESAMDDAGEMQHWARLGMAAALRKAARPARAVKKKSA